MRFFCVMKRVLFSTRGLVRKQVNVEEHDPVECQGVVNGIECPQPRFEATGAAVMLCRVY
jgi:hypothetical protein